MSTAGDREAPTIDLLQGASPLGGMTPRLMAAAVGRWAAAVTRHPLVAAAESLKWGAKQAEVLAGTSEVEPEPKDKRFADPAWQAGGWKRLAQSYLVTGRAVLESVEKVGLEEKSVSRARFALGQVVDAAAPTNNLWTNPAALERMVKTRGRSVVDGGRHFLHDVLHNGGLPSQVDTRPFRVGETIATSPGEVIYRSSMFELIQYQPTTPEVGARPTVVLPPQINRYYFLDLAPGRSFVEYALSRGIQTYMVSWRNPSPAERDWGVDEYVRSSIEALEVAAAVSGSESVNVTGFCAGGMTQLAALSHLASTGRQLVNASTTAVTLVDTHVWSSLNAVSTAQTMRSAVGKSRRKGVLGERDLARTFAWVRANDLVWNYWVSNYLMGDNPPAFDVLAWNADATNLPHKLHAEFVDVWQANALLLPNRFEVLGTPVDLSQVKVDSYVVGASTDHLVPWQSAYAATQVLGGDVRFVLSNSGHIQALVNPPGNPKASFYLNPDNPSDPEVWLKGADKVQASWWEDWATWTLERSGDMVPAPESMGSDDHPPIVAAPGVYVRQ